MPSRPKKKAAPALTNSLTFRGKKVSLDMKPGTEYRLAQAGYTFPGSFVEPDTALLASVELLRICSGTDMTGEQIADSLKDFQPLTHAIIAMMDEMEQAAKNEQSTKGSEAGNG